MDLEAGLRIGPYRLVERIGEGGMGVVWKARDTVLERNVAIKFLPPAFARDPGRLARFEREAKAVAALSHPGILSIFGFGEHQGVAYAVTELLEGRTLREALAAGSLPPARTAKIARQIASGLAAAHDRGIIHRDLKPENIFITREGHTKVLDFGLAAHVAADGLPGNPQDGSLAPTRTSLTTPGTVLGTTDYLSPEQVRGVAADARSDVFSFGSVLYEMLTGRRPFQRETASETMTAILREEPAWPATGAPALEAIARRCLAKDPSARFTSARELASGLETAESAEAGGRRSRRRSALVAAIAVIVAGVAVLAWKGRALLGGVPSAAVPPPSVSSIGEPPSASAEANEYFEKGLLFLRGRLDMTRAQAMLDRAIELDPSFGTARAMRALTNLIALHEGYSNDGGLIYASERTARDVLAKQPDLASAHAALGAALLYLNRKEQARREFDTALRLNPQSNPGLAWVTIDDELRGRFEAAEARARAVLREVPLFWAARIFLSNILFDEGNVEDARRQIQKVFEEDPSNLTAVRAMARVDIYGGDIREGRAMLEKISAATHPNFRIRLVWALLLAREGRSDEAAAALDPETLKYAGVALFAQAQVAEVYALAGRTDAAIDWLDRAVRNGDERAAWFRRDAFLEGIRAQPRFQLILDAIDHGKR